MKGFPFKQKDLNSLLIREFSKDVDSSELVWHRDRADRHVKIREGTGWQLQLENSLPINLRLDCVYFIPKNTYHRVIKGRGNLVVEIKEGNKKMKITKRQLRKIIKEEVEKAAPFGSGMEQASLEPEEKELVGHT